MPVSVITDSTSDIEPARARELGIGVVPLFVLWGDRSFRDYVDLSRREFYERLAGEQALPVTSQPSPAMFEQAFAAPAAAGDEILCLTISARLSGTINAARAAAARFAPARIEIVDSQTVAGGLGMMVRRAGELARAGASLEQILSVVERFKQTQRLFACLSDLSHLERNGRIGKARAAVGTLMRIVPVLSLRDGQICAQAQVRTFARARETMLDLALESVTDVSAARFLVMHTNAPALADAALLRLQERLGGVRPRLLEVAEAGPVIATHGGPGAVGVFLAQD